MADWHLAIDFGTSYSAACLWADGATVPLEVGGERRMPSAVLLGDDDGLVVGSAAVHEAGLAPDRFEPTPKEYLGRDRVLIGGTEVSVDQMVGAVLAVFLVEARRQRGGTSPASVALTHPARWSEERLSGLRAAAEAAGIEAPVLIPEPVAAATHYLRAAPAAGQRVAVYDLGGGTFDTAVLETSTEGAIQLVGAPGGDASLGGEVFDHRLFQLVGRHLASSHPDVWEHLSTSQDRPWRRAALDLLREVRRAKEVLSERSRTAVYVEKADRDVVLTRSEFDDLIEADVDRTVDELERTIVEASGLDVVTAVYLAGGSSRIPLIAQKVGERFGDWVQTWGDPKGVVAMGAAVALARNRTLPDVGATVKLSPASPRGSEPLVPSPSRSARLESVERHRVSEDGSPSPGDVGEGPISESDEVAMPPSVDRGRRSRRSIVTMVIVLLLLAALVTAAGLLLDGVPGTSDVAASRTPEQDVVGDLLALDAEYQRELVLSAALMGPGCAGSVPEVPPDAPGFARTGESPESEESPPSNPECPTYCDVAIGLVAAAEDCYEDLLGELESQWGRTDDAEEEAQAAVTAVVPSPTDPELEAAVNNVAGLAEQLPVLRSAVIDAQLPLETVIDRYQRMAIATSSLVEVLSRTELDGADRSAAAEANDLATASRGYSYADSLALSVVPSEFTIADVLASQVSDEASTRERIQRPRENADMRVDMWREGASIEAERELERGLDHDRVQAYEEEFALVLTADETTADPGILTAGSIARIDAFAATEDLVLAEGFG